MIGRLAALILLSALSQPKDIPELIPLTWVEPDDNLTLTCPVSMEQASLVYWYRFKFGYMAQTIASGAFDKLSLQGQFVNSRFEVSKVDDQYHLNIRNVSKEDEAMYLCQVGTAYSMNIVNGTVLVMKGHKNQKPVYVQQRPKTASVRMGDSVTFHCSILSKSKTNRVQCPGDHSVYWFRAGSETHPSIVYTHSHRTDEEEKRSCVYSLSKTIRDSSDNGTYYCAVDTCGEILFGEGTEVNTREEQFPHVIVIGSLLVCCVVVIVALTVKMMCRKHKCCEHCKATSSSCAVGGEVTEDQLNNADGEGMAMNYVALDFSSRRRDRGTKNREFPADCLYSGIREYE